jgi:hypothetical protein
MVPKKLSLALTCDSAHLSLIRHDIGEETHVRHTSGTGLATHETHFTSEVMTSARSIL